MAPQVCPTWFCELRPKPQDSAVLAVTKAGSVPVHSRRLGEICYLVRYRVGAGGGSQAEMCEPLTRKFVQPWTDSLEMGYSHQASCSPALPQGTESLTR